MSYYEQSPESQQFFERDAEEAEQPDEPVIVEAADADPDDDAIEYDADPPIDRPLRRSTLDMGVLRAQAERQSREFGATSSTGVFQSPPPKMTTSQLSQTKKPTSSKERVMIGGIFVKVNATKNSAVTSQVRLWPKLDRPKMKPDVKLAFQKSATGFVLSKTNKLSVPVVTNQGEAILTEIHNLSSQLQALKEHCHDYDMLDVFEIVVPEQVSKKSDLEAERFQLFEDYAKLTPDMVANSNAWYNLWISEPYIRENMSYSLTLLKNNTEESLWSKCLEDYKEFHVDQRGGPLMLYLILRRIQDVSETTIGHLKTKLSHLAIKDLKGEDVDIAVSLVKSTYSALKSASTQERNFVPDDLPNTVLEVFQTTSVPEFNSVFQREQQIVRTEADKVGGLPKWPTIQQLTSLATNTYSRLKHSNAWDVPDAAKAKALVSSSSDPTPQSSKPRPKYKCFNCGSEDHLLSDCPKPKDQAKIESNKKSFSDGKRRAPGKGGKPRKPKTSTGKDGTPMVLNKKGTYVMDQKKVSKQKAVDTIIEQLALIPDSVSKTTSESNSTTQSTTSAPSANTASRADLLRSAFKALSS